MKATESENDPVIGQVEENAAAGAALEEGGVVLAGPPGAGKTRLARRVVARARRTGRETEWLAAAPECAASPFGVVLPLIGPGEVHGARPVELLVRAAGHMADRARRMDVTRARPPERPVRGDMPATLSPREREIATLAAGGLASKVIADRLSLSVRTVDNHLAHVYTKTGVSGRAELGALIRP